MHPCASPPRGLSIQSRTAVSERDERGIYFYVVLSQRISAPRDVGTPETEYSIQAMTRGRGGIQFDCAEAEDNVLPCDVACFWAGYTDAPRVCLKWYTLRTCPLNDARTTRRAGALTDTQPLSNKIVRRTRATPGSLHTYG